MPKKAKSNKKTLTFLIFILAIVVASMFLFKPVQTPKSEYEVTVGEGNEKATVRLNFQSAYVMSLTSYVAEWQDGQGNTISKITWSVTVTLTDVSNMQYDSQQTSYVKIKVTGSGKSKIYQINLSWQTSTKATGSLTKSIDTFLSEIGVTIDDGESVTFNNYLYEAKIYLKGTISGNSYTASIGEQSSSFDSFTIKKPLVPISVSKIEAKYSDDTVVSSSSGAGTSYVDVTSKMTDNNDNTYIHTIAFGTSSDPDSCGIMFRLTVSGTWSNVKIEVKLFSYDSDSKQGVDCWADGSHYVRIAGAWSLTWRTIYDGEDLRDVASDGVIILHLKQVASDCTTYLRVAELRVTDLNQTASFIDFFKRTDIQVALIVAVILVLAIFVKKRKKVKRYARRH